MKVRMKGDVSGSRNGVPWPARGEVMELPDDEGAQLCASGLATPVKDTEDDVEKTVREDDAEQRAGLTKETAAALTTGGDNAGQGDGSSSTQTPPAKKTTTPAKKTAAAAKRAAAPAKPQGDNGS